MVEKLGFYRKILMGGMCVCRSHQKGLPAILGGTQQTGSLMPIRRRGEQGRQPNKNIHQICPFWVKNCTLSAVGKKGKELKFGCNLMVAADGGDIYYVCVVERGRVMSRVEIVWGNGREAYRRV